jgi:hypothetical protein
MKYVAAKCVAATFVAARPLPEISRFPKDSVLPIYSDHHFLTSAHIPAAALRERLLLPENLSRRAFVDHPLTNGKS